jgi:hypothetical protein
MIYNLEYGQINERHGALSFLEENKFSTVLDVGASYYNWASNYVTHTLDLNRMNGRHTEIDTSRFRDKPNEIRFYWKDTFSVKFLNEDFIGPSEESYLELVHTFLNANS